jgi:hypothetical protein
MLHVAAGGLWLGWKHEPGEFGSATRDAGVWNGGSPESWTDPSWIGVEDVRKRVRVPRTREIRRIPFLVLRTVAGRTVRTGSGITHP